jgi:hypothetical protein
MEAITAQPALEGEQPKTPAKLLLKFFHQVNFFEMLALS